MSNPYIEHFRREVAILGSSLEKDDELLIKDFKEVIENVLEVFSTQGNSGGSAPYSARAVAKAIENTMLFKPLSPLTGEPGEWGEVEQDDDGMQQNNRLSSVFKQGKKGKPYYLDAIVWRGEEEYDSFTGQVEDVQSRQYVRWPFTPKTFYIEVVKEYYNGEPEDQEPYYEEDYTDGTKKYYKYVIKDRSQLSKVWEVYEEYKPNKNR
jgi:hypothetical protein